MRVKLVTIGEKELSLESFKEVMQQQNVALRLDESGERLEVYRTGSFKGRLMCWLQRKDIRKAQSRAVLDKFVELIRREYQEKYGDRVANYVESGITKTRIYKKGLRLTSKRISALFKGVDKAFKSFVMDYEEVGFHKQRLYDYGVLPKSEYKVLTGDLDFFPPKAMAEVFSETNSPYFASAFFTALKDLQTGRSQEEKESPIPLKLRQLESFDPGRSGFTTLIDEAGLKLNALRKEIREKIEAEGKRNGGYVLPERAKEIAEKIIKNFIRLRDFTDILQAHLKGANLSQEEINFLNKMNNPKNVNLFKEYLKTYFPNKERGLELKKICLSLLKEHLNNEHDQKSLLRGTTLYSRLNKLLVEKHLHQAFNNLKMNFTKVLWLF